MIAITRTEKQQSLFAQAIYFASQTLYTVMNANNRKLHLRQLQHIFQQQTRKRKMHKNGAHWFSFLGSFVLTVRIHLQH